LFLFRHSPTVHLLFSSVRNYGNETHPDDVPVYIRQFVSIFYLQFDLTSTSGFFVERLTCCVSPVVQHQEQSASLYKTMNSYVQVYINNFLLELLCSSRSSSSSTSTSCKSLVLFLFSFCCVYGVLLSPSCRTKSIAGAAESQARERVNPIFSPSLLFATEKRYHTVLLVKLETLLRLLEPNNPFPEKFVK
jgi:hypothetical protein